MKTLSLLIKPVSDSCNLNCRYCFYHDVSSKRTTPNFGRMSEETAELLIRKALSFADEAVIFAFQGGEPTLAGLDFFSFFADKVNEHNGKNLKVSYAIQTNGTLLDDNWCEFFSNNRFLVGISLDGKVKNHDANRIDRNDKGTFHKVMESIRKLEAHQVDFNILTVVNRRNYQDIREIYGFFKKNNFRFLQFIPCLTPFNVPFYKDRYALTYNEYHQFLEELFSCYYQDAMNGNYMSIRHFDNLLLGIGNLPINACEFKKYCSLTLVIESNGNVYPCDFYCLDEYLLGNIRSDSLEDLVNSRAVNDFINEKTNHSKACLKCEYYKLCHGGCKRYWNEEHLNYYCPAYRRFLDSNLDKIRILADRIMAKI